MVVTGELVCQSAGEIVTGIPVEQVGFRLIVVSKYNDEFLIFPSNSDPNVFYQTHVNSEYCSCKGFTYHKFCRHRRLAEVVKHQREERNKNVRPLVVVGVCV